MSRISLFPVLWLAVAVAMLPLGGVRAFGQSTLTVTRFDDAAANQTYTNPSDGLGAGNSGDLRFEMLAAMAAGGTNTIRFASSCTVATPCQITLNGPLPPIFELNNASSFSLTIDGGTEGSVILDGNSLAGATNRVFFADNVAVTLRNLVIQNATAQGGTGAGGGGGGAGFGAGLFVNQATASVTVQNTSFLNCSVVGGTGSNGTTGGGGGMAFPGASGSGGGGGGGVTGPGSGGGTGAGGSAYGANNRGANNSIPFSGNFGGNGGSGGGGGDYGNGGFGGGGGNDGAGGFGGGGGFASNGGFGGGGGGGNTGQKGGGGIGGVYGGNGASIDGGGGAAAGPAIFVVNGSVTFYNVTGSQFLATGGQPGSPVAIAGTADATPVFNYGGTVNGSPSVGPIKNAFTLTEPVGQTSATEIATLTLTSSISANVSFTINVLTQGAPNLDFQLAQTQGSNATDCVSGTAYSAGATCTVQYTFKPAYPGVRYGGITLTDSAGNLYASALINGIGTGPQMTFNAASTTINTLGGASFSSSGSYKYPDGVAVDAAGNVYVTSALNGQSTIAKLPSGCASSACITPLGAGLSGAAGLALDGAGNIYVADANNSAVQEIPSTCTSTSCVITLGSGFVRPYGVAVDGAGNVYVADGSSNHGGLYRMSAGCASSNCVTSLNGGFNRPYGVAVDGIGNIYVADAANNAVKEISAACTSSSCVIPIGSGFSFPQGIAIDGGGNIYVADTNNSAVKEIPYSGGSYGTPVTLGSGYNLPWSVAVDGSGNVYVADTQNNLVKEIALATPPSLSFATPTLDGTTDTADAPQAVTVENIGNAPLMFFSPTPSISTGFNLGTESTSCVQLQSEILAAGNSCTLTTIFAPVVGQSGSASGWISLTDNDLNQANAQQTVPMSGTAKVVLSTVTHFDNYVGSVALGSTTNFFIYIANPSATSPLSNVSATVTLPSGLVFAGGSGGNCGTTVASGSTVTLSGISLAAGGACQSGIYLTATQLGSQSVSTLPAAGGVNGTVTSVQVNVVDVPASLQIIGTPSSAYVGASVPFTVTALDPLGNPDLVYTGTVVLTSSDAAASLPGSAMLTNGTGSFTAAFNTVGSQTITATDAATSLSKATSPIQVSIPNLVVTTNQDDAGTASNCTPQTTSGTGTDTACSLRDAIAEAQSLGSGNITFAGSTYSGATAASPAVYSMPANGPLKITGNSILTMTGPTDTSGNNLLAIDGGNGTLIFNFSGSGNTVLNHLTVQNGNGGGMYVGAGTVALTNSIVSGNTAGRGGGMYIDGGTVTLTNTTLSGNSSSTVGGGMYIIGGTVTVANSTLSGNNAGNAGGGFNINGGTMMVVNSTLFNNGANIGGAAIINSGTVTVTNSTLSGNFGGYSGGGVKIFDGTVSLYNSIVAGNIVGPGPSDIDGALSNSVGNIIGSSGVNLSALGNYGGPTQTMLPLPGTTAICAGLTSISGVTIPGVDQRGTAHSANYCPAGTMDAGAVQTSYGLSFTTQPPSSDLVAQVMSPAPVVTVTESGVALTAGSAAVSVTDTASPSDLSASSPLSANNSTSPARAGQASFSNLIFSGVESSDGLIASLQVGTVTGSSPAVPIFLTASSSTFAVNQAVPSVTSSPAASAITYGQTLASSSLLGGSASVPGSFSFTTPVTAPSVGTANQSVTFTPTSSSYSVVLLSVPVTVNRAVPTATAPFPSAITYGQTLASSTLTGGTSSVPGKFAFTAPSTAPSAGSASQSITFTPTDSTDYGSVLLSVMVTVNKASPSVPTPPTASAITYGQTLASSTLSGGTSSVPGKFAFTAPSTAPSAGTANQSTTFTPTDTADYSLVLLLVAVTVNQTAPVVSWSTPAAITYGTALSSTQLNATASVPGSFQYTPASGVLGAGLQTLSVKFTPTDATDYSPVTKAVTLVVNQATPVVSWSTPAAIIYGAALSSTQLNATASVPGSFVYSPSSGVLGAGSQTLSVKFTPTDTTDYTTASATVTLAVNQATPVVTWSMPGPITYGTVLSSTQLNATASVPGSFQYTPASGVLGAGSQTLSVKFTPTDATDYSPVTKTVALVVNQATPVVSWSTPAAITYGAALSSTQLNATASVPGSFVYSPSSGVLGAGSQTLSVKFTPTDATDYGSQTKTVTLAVNKASTTISDTLATTQTVMGTTATFTAAVKPQIGGTPTGTITYLNGSATLGSAPVGTPFTTPVLPAGTDQLKAVYSGDSNFNGSTSSATAVVSLAPSVVQFCPTITQLVYPLSQLVYNVGVLLKNLEFTTGTITLYDGSTAIGTYSISPLGVYLGITPTLAVGTHSLKVVYNGDSNYPPGQSAVVIVTVVGL